MNGRRSSKENYCDKAKEDDAILAFLPGMMKERERKENQKREGEEGIKKIKVKSRHRITTDAT